MSAERHPSSVRPSIVHRPLTRASRELLHGWRPHVIGKLPIHHTCISKLFFFFFFSPKFSIFTLLVTLQEPKFQNATPNTFFIPYEPNFISKVVSQTFYKLGSLNGNIKLYRFWLRSIFVALLGNGFNIVRYGAGFRNATTAVYFPSHPNTS